MSKYTEHLARHFYNLAMCLLLPFAILKLYWKSRANPHYRARLGQRLGLGLPQLDGCILVHAVSVGEAVAAFPFVEKLLEEFPSRDILVTSTTPTGYERITTLFNERVEQCVLPFDTSFFAGKLLRQTKPAVVIIIETEIWPNLIYQCHQRKIPIFLANARLSNRSFNGYKKAASVIKPILQKITRIAAHASPDHHRFLELGANPNTTQCVGSIKFDLRLPLGLDENKRALLDQFHEGLLHEDKLHESHENKRPFIWVAASTHEGEEELIIKVMQKLNANKLNYLCILVPRHQERFETVARLLDNSNLKFHRFSQERQLPTHTNILLGDTMGDLMLFYAVADAAFVGGSLVPVGGHNVLESMACKTATLVGPHMFNFKTIHELLINNKAVIEVKSWEQLAEQLLRLAQNNLLRTRIADRGEAVVQANRGALDRLVFMTHQLVDS